MRLLRLYKRHGIKFLKPQTVYLQELRKDQAELQTARMNFSLRLAAAISDSSMRTIYIDETTFNTWQRPDRSWMHADRRVRIPLDSQRVGRVTLYGAIGSGLMHPVFHFGSSTNTEDFLEFIN